MGGFHYWRDAAATTESGRCLTCGHIRAEHATCSSGAYWCNGSGCTCDGFELTGGGDARDPRDQVGVDPTGPATAAAEPAHPVWGYPFPAAGAPDLQHAIQAATDALNKGWVIQGELHRQHVARVAVEAAAPVLLQATRDRLAWVAQLRKTAEAYIAEYDALEPYEWAEEFRIALDGPAAQEDGGGG